MFNSAGDFAESKLMEVVDSYLVGMDFNGFNIEETFISDNLQFGDYLVWVNGLYSISFVNSLENKDFQNSDLTVYLNKLKQIKEKAEEIKDKEVRDMFIQVKVSDFWKEDSESLLFELNEAISEYIENDLTSLSNQADKHVNNSDIDFSDVDFEAEEDGNYGEMSIGDYYIDSIGYEAIVNVYLDDSFKANIIGFSEEALVDYVSNL